MASTTDTSTLAVFCTTGPSATVINLMAALMPGRGLGWYAAHKTSRCTKRLLMYVEFELLAFMLIVVSSPVWYGVSLTIGAHLFLSRRYKIRPWIMIVGMATTTVCVAYAQMTGFLWGLELIMVLLVETVAVIGCTYYYRKTLVAREGVQTPD